MILINIKRADLYKDQKIEKSLKDNPDFSVREIAADIKLPPSTVYFILTTRMNYKSMLLQKVPHELTSEQKIKRVECSQALLEHMEIIKKSGYRYFSTGDESFFFWDTRKKRIWLPTDEKPPQFPTAKFFATKTMITIFWSPCGIQVLKALEPGQSFNSTYFKDHILNELLTNKYVANSKKHKKKFSFKLIMQDLTKVTPSQSFVRKIIFAFCHILPTHLTWHLRTFFYLDI